MKILTVNTGSSSVRLALFSEESGRLRDVSRVHFRPDEDTPGNQIRDFLKDECRHIKAVSHRVVHGGTRFVRSCLVDEEVEREIDRLSSLAPLHNPLSLKWIRTCRELFGPVPQAGVFDTAFYASLPEVSTIYALSGELCAKHGIRRYGFHGIAHRAMFERYKEIRPDTGVEGRVISIQLGSGCSMTAVRNGRPVDTSMGFSPNEGLVMSTRSGDIDPGVITYLQDRAGLSVHDVEDMLNKSSGLFGVSGISSDMRTLLASEKPDAARAVELYCYRVKKYIGSYTAALGGVDAVLFGGGVGENSPLVREKILDGMQWCGIELDREANGACVGKEGFISRENSRVDAAVIPVDEAGILAREALDIIIRVSL